TLRGTAMRRLSIPVAALAATALLAACGGGGGTGDEPTTDTETTAAETSAAATGNLAIWVDENRKPAADAAAATFTAETGVQVELVVKNFGDIRADFLAQVPTGEGPDITVGAHDWLGSFIINGVVDSVDLAGMEGDFESVALEAFTYDGQ